MGADAGRHSLAVVTVREIVHVRNEKHHNAWKRQKPSRDDESGLGTTMRALCLHCCCIRWARGLRPQSKLKVLLMLCLARSSTCVGEASLSSCRRGNWSALRVLPKLRSASEKSHSAFSACAEVEALRARCSLARCCRHARRTTLEHVLLLQTCSEDDVLVHAPLGRRTGSRRFGHLPTRARSASCRSHSSRSACVEVEAMGAVFSSSRRLGQSMVFAISAEIQIRTGCNKAWKIARNESFETH